MLKASAIYLFGRAAAALLSIVSIALFSRLLTSSEFGFYSLIMTTAALANTLFCTWVAQSLFRFFPDAKDRKALLSTAFAALIGSGLFSSTLAAVIAVLVVPDSSTVFVLGIILIFVGWSFFEYLTVCFGMYQRPGLFLEAQLLRLACCILLPLSAWMAWGSFDWFLLAMGAAYWVPCLVPRYLFWATGISRHAVRADVFRRQVSYGVPLGLSIFLVSTSQYAERYLIGGDLGANRLAGYAIGADLALLSVGMIGSALNQAFYPALLQLHASGNDSARTLFFQRYCLVFLALLVPSALGLHLLANDIVALVAGPSLRGDAQVSLEIICATALLIGIKSFIVDISFQLRQAMKTSLIISLISVTILLLSAGWAIPLFGLVGASLAGLFAAASGLVLAAFLAIQARSLPSLPLSELAKIGGSLAAMFIAIELARPLFAVSTRIAVLIPLGALVYGAFLWLMRFQEADNAMQQARVAIRRRWTQR